MDPQSLLQVTLASFFPPWYRNKRIWSCTQGTSLRQHPICVQNASMPCFDCVRNGHVARFCKMLLNNRLGIRVARWKQLLVSMHTHTIFQRRLWRVNEHCCNNVDILFMVQGTTMLLYPLSLKNRPSRICKRTLLRAKRPPKIIRSPIACLTNLCPNDTWISSKRTDQYFFAIAITDNFCFLGRFEVEKP